MSGQKGMKQFGKQILEEVKKQRESGRTYKEIAECFNLRNSESVRELLKRERRNQKKVDAGILPRRRGRPRKGHVTTEREKENEINRLRMENELLRDFLHAAGRM